MKKNLQKNSLLFNHKEHKEITKNTIFNLKSENCKLLTLFCLLLFCFLLPQKVQAQIIYRAGTSTQPHQIPNATAMNQFRDLVANGNRTYINENIYWELTANISYSGGRIGAGGSNDYFTGHFNGNGHTITSNAISHTSWDYVGFFSWTRNAHFKNFTLSIPYVDGRNYVGGLIGEVHRNLTIDNVHVRLTSSTDWYGQFCGGMIGNTWDIAGYSVNISNSSVVTGTVRLHRGSGHYDAGGLIGGVRHSTNSNPASATINITDVLVDVTFSPQSDRNVIGGVIGWIEHNKTVNFTRVVAVSVIPSAGSYQRGRIIGSMGNNTKANFSAVFASNTATIGNMYPSATTSGTVTSMHSWTGNHWTDNSRVYDLLERRNNLNGVIAAGTRGNEKWGYDIAGRPQISTTAYAVRVARGTGVSSISGVRFVDGTNNYVNANQILTVIPTTTPNGNQRINYTFTPAYNHSSGAANNFSAEMSGNNWRLTARVNGTVTSSIINIPHPLIPGVDFDQWTRNVTLDWNYNNPQNLTGRFYVYRREAAPASGAWALIAPTGGTSVENGSSRSMNVTNAIATADFNKTFEYCIAFVEGTGSAPASPNDINVNNRITVSVNTTPTMGTWTVTATPADNNIAVSFTADNRLTNSADYSYSIERSVNGGAYTNWLTNQNFSGATSYSHTDNMPTSPCDAYKYRVGISAFNTAFQRESEEARITGNTKFTVAEPFKATKGEYANYVRLQWKVDRISGGSPETFRVFRRVANTNDQFIELETVTSNSATVYWNDNNALTGVYYEYRVTLYQVCSGNETPLETKTDIGFTQAFGVVSGRVTYGTGNAVQGVNTLVRRNDLQQGESQYHSLKSTGGGQKFEWLADQTYFNNIWTSKNWTLQFWVNPESSNTGTNIMGYIGGNAISMTAVSGGYQIYTAMGTAYRSEIIPAHHFSHIVITRSGDNVKIYTVCDQNRDSIYIKNTSFTYTTATNQMAADCKISFGHNFRGNIDDVRFWNRSLSEAEITRDYSRRLAGNESGLRGYWTFDENLTDYAFDMSRVGTVYNGNHATTNTLVFDNKIPDEKYQLALKGITDADGNYQISGIPYVGEGTSYSIVPSLGVHQFNPTQQLRYISPNSMVHNATDFTDISSFTVSGYVVYEGGNYPVVGCSFEIDDQVVTRPNGELVKTDNDGFFTISVPIGIHKVRVVKQGHTFAADGYLKKLVIDPTSGEEYYVDLNYNAPVNNVYFYDQTRVKLIGRVVGGLTENDKPLGFGESVNNIGMHTLTLETTRLPYNFTNTPFSETFNHNEGQWRKPGGIADDQTSVTYNQKNITISVSPETGEFVAHIYPEPYNIREIRVPGAGGVQLTVYNNNEMIDLTNAVTTNPEYMRTSVRIWTDSTFVSGKPGVLDHWQYFELSDTVRYHYDWKYYYQSTPTFSVEQLVNGEPVDFFGEESFILSDAFTGETDTLSLYHNGNYLFEKPVFRQGMPYVFFMSAYEEYTNYISDPAEIVRYPVKEGKVNMSNNIKLNPSPETIDMDENGKAAYIFMAGAPNLTTGSNDFFATLSLGAISYYWDMGLEPVDVWHLGEKSTGNDFMTAGPDKVDIILRDPPGSRSKAFIERGTTIVSKNTTNIQNSVEVAATLNFLFGMKQTTFAGLGGGVINEFELIHDLTLGMHTEEKWTTNTVNTTTTTFTERVETSDDPIYVGHYGDVFIGNSTNILYGLTNGINIVKISDLEDDDEPLYVGTNYSIAPTLSFSFGQTFDTRFVFTTVDIEEIMIPKWRSGLENLLKPMGTQVNTAFISNPVYVSKLPRSHENWGKINMDPVFGNLASPPDSPDDGPSYKVFFPNDYDMELFDMDSVMYFNNQINLWIATLTQNEREKVQMARKGNYSFGSGASITYTETTETDKTTITGFSFMLNPSIATKHGFQVCKVGLTIEGKADYKYEKETIEEDSKISTIITGFTLQEEGDDDQLTVDYGTTASGTFAFKTRGGRTSCPYEGLLVTQYFEPGQHILSEATLQIEVPKIRVASAPMVLNVPANKEATFLLALENESETNEDVYFMLKVDEFTNPHGAVLKIDGLGIGNGRVFLVKAGQTLYKTLTVGKGTADRYENIGLILMSMCQYDPTVEHIEDIYDKTYISVEFIPAVSDVAIAEPTQNWILNADNQTGDTLYVTLNNYDVNFPNFGLIKLEYRPISSPNWSTIMTFYPSLLYPKAQGAKENIGTRPQIVYPWKMPKEDGAYELRATTASVNIASDSTIIGNPLSTFITDAVAGYKDVTRPSALGAPSPASGILGIGDELSITFNEDIQTGMLIKDNFSITGILNAQEIAEPNVGIAFAGVHSAQTELPIFTNGSFSIETWFMRTPGTAGTLFAFGSNNNNISLGFNTAGNAILKIGNETYTSVIAIANDETWKYIAMAYNREDNTVSVYKFEGSNTDNTLFTNRALTAIPETQGKLIVGNDFSFLNGFNGAMAQLHIYGISREEADIAADKSLSKSGREHGLIGYWLMDEAEGNIAKDKARARHLTLNTDWYIYPSGYAKQTNNNYFSINTANYSLNAFCDFTLEFWFRSTGTSQPNQTLLSCDNGYIATNATGGLTLFKNDGTVIRTLTTNNLTDTKWHHVALSVKRNGNANVYIDGMNVATFAETLLGTFSSGFYYFGAKRTPPNTFDNYFTGYFDEIRIWNSALTRESIMLNKNSKLRGDEHGLQAYYPFENYIKQSNGLITVIPTNENNAETDDFTAAGTVTGFSTIAVPVKDVRHVENVPFTYVASSNKIVFTLDNSYFARVEGTTLTITVKDVYDMRNNKSNTEQWTAYVKRNPLLWDADPIYIQMQKGETKTFTARIVNSGGATVSYSIENLPAWLTVNNSVGNLQPLASRELTFSIPAGVNIGNYETALRLTCGNGVMEILPVQLKVTGQRPDWEVNPNDFENSMNIIGQIQIEGVFQEDPDDLLGAFIGNLCVGVASPIYFDAINAYFVFADIYGNSVHNNQPITFKLWDASTGRIYPQVETSVPDIRFVPNQIIGKSSNPVIFNALDASEQIISLRTGWTWVSANVLSNDPSILNQMKASLSTAGILIKGHNGFIQQPGWIGNLTEISETQMYQINSNRDHALVLSGVSAKPAETPITINNAWNWIGYIPSLNLPVSSALAGIDAQTDDQIKGQNGFAVYMEPLGWIGSLQTMQSGQGYMYYSNNPVEYDFYYPSTGGRGGSPALPDGDYENDEDSYDLMVLRSSGLTPVWTPNTSGYSGTMTMMAVVFDAAANANLSSDMIEIGAFSNGECRGSVFLQYISALDQYLGFLMIYGEGNETITLKVYDHDTAMEYDANNEPIVFVANGMFGEPANPYIISLGTAALSDVATLSNLTVSEGLLTPTFNSNVYNYTANVPYNVTSLILTGIATDVNATVTGNGTKTINVGANVFTITVTAADGVTELEYTVTVNRALNTVATLSNLTVSTGTLSPVFSSTQYIYTVDVPYSVTSLTLAAVATDINATVAGDGVKTLTTGFNLAVITVTAEDGVTTLTYMVLINRAYNNVATLSNLTVSEGTLTPAFSSTVYNYSVTVPYNVSLMTLTALATDVNATVVGDGVKDINVGINQFTIIVMAEDGVTTLNYTITITRADNPDASLSNLTVSEGTLTPVFNSAVYSYTVDVPFGVSLMTLTAIATDVNATVIGDDGKTLNVGTNVFDITVIAADGVTQLVYTVTVNRAANTIATLSSLTVSEGLLTPIFNSTVYNYTVNVPYNVTSLILTGIATDVNATVIGNGLKPIVVGANEFTITVTAADGVTELEYTVTVNRALNTNATLSNLTVSTGILSPVFNGTQYIYTVDVPYSVSSITLTAVATDINATVVGDGVKNLTTGANMAVITVTAADGVTTLTYTVLINRAYNNVATLSNLTVSEGTLTPAFSSTVYNYSVTVPYNVSLMTLTALATDVNATVVGDGVKDINVGVNQFTIIVMAEDGVTTLNYTVTITRADNPDATLSNLTVSEGTLTPVFNSAVYSYTVDVPFGVSLVTLTAITTDVNATVIGDGGKTLNVGTNVFDITVIAADGVTQLVYTVIVTRAANTIATLSSLTVSEGLLTPIFNSTVYNYTVNVPYNVTSLILTGIATDVNATVIGNGLKPIVVGANEFTITVTAADGVTELEYTVTVNRALNTNATLSNLTVSTGTLSPMFNGTQYIYTVDVPYSVSLITLTAITTDINATVVGDGVKTLSTGANMAMITVTAADGVTTLTYIVLINRAYNNIATLSNLTVSEGTLTPTFSSGIYNYSANVPYSVSSITLTALTTDVNAIVVGDGVKTLNIGVNQFTVIVVAEDGVTTLNYTVTVTRANNSDASLSNLTVSTGTLTPAFSSTQYNYSVDVPFNVTSLTLTATATFPTATIVGDGLKSLIVGANVFTITVTAADNVTQLVYTVTVNRAANTIASLSSLTVSEGLLTPTFNSNVYNYTANVPYNVTSLILTGIATDVNATVIGNGLKPIIVGANEFTITVTAADGVTELEYTITVNRALNTNATLSNLTVSTGTLNPVFNSTQYIYTVDVPYNVSSITLTAVATDVNATVAGDGVKTLTTGTNTFAIKVTAADGLTVLEYTVTVHRVCNSDATLSDIIISEGELSPEFFSTNYAYTVAVNESVTALTINAISTDPNAKVIGAGLKVLVPGTNTFMITVIAEDGIAQLQYMVTVTRTVGMDEHAQKTEILVYPNPTTGELRVANYELRIDDIKVFDIYGKMLKVDSRKSEIGQSEIEINIAHLPSGVYFLQIQTDKGLINKKVIKQ